MEKDGQIIGHVMFSKAELSIEADGKTTGKKLPIATFGPISIHPDFKRQGYLNGIEATYTPPQGYFVAEENPEDFAKYEAEFPYKEKLVLPGQLG